MCLVLVGRRVEQFARGDGLPPHVRRIDERRRAADRDGFLERPDLQVGVHVAVKPEVSAMPSRLNALNPVSVNVTV